MSSLTTLNQILAQEPGYLSLDIARGLCPMTVTVKEVVEKVFGSGASAEKSVALVFVETNRYITLNKTRSRQLGDIVKGDAPLAGTKIKLVVDEFETGKGKKEQVGILSPDAD